ncbi:MAG: DUF7144 family membrane protein [Nocardioides sp.]
MSSSTTRRTEPDNYSGGAVGVTAFAGVFMILAGVMGVVQGLVALVNDDFYVIGKEYIFEFDLTTWGWIHLIVGLVVAGAGAALFQGAVWARVVAIIIASLSIVVNLLWIPYYPIWSLVAITFSALVIWAATMHGRDIAAE